MPDAASAESLLFYPQPSHEVLYFNGPDMLHFESYDLMGRMHLAGRVEAGTAWKLEHPPKGVSTASAIKLADHCSCSVAWMIAVAEESPEAGALISLPFPLLRPYF